MLYSVLLTLYSIKCSIETVTDEFYFAAYVVLGLSGLQVVLIFVSVYLVFGRAEQFDQNSPFAIPLGEAINPNEVDMNSVRDSVSVVGGFPSSVYGGKSEVSLNRASFDSTFSHRARGSFDATGDVRASIDRRTMQSNPSAIDDVL